MSTEWFVAPRPPCPTCKRGFDPVRIGVSALGWTFGFDPLPGSGATDKATWLAYLADKVIVDEYGNKKTPAEFAAFVESKEGHRRS